MTQKVHYIGKDYSTLQKEDGIYTGTAIGYDELVVEVKVEVKNNKIIHIEVIKDGSTHPEHGIDFHACAIIISENIVEMSSTQIDTISGATSTSTGILKAVDNAIGE